MTHVVDKRRGHDSFEDSLERALDKGVWLPAADRLVAMTTRNGPDRLDIVVRVPLDQPSSCPVTYGEGGPAACTVTRS